MIRESRVIGGPKVLTKAGIGCCSTHGQTAPRRNGLIDGSADNLTAVPAISLPEGAQAADCLRFAVMQMLNDNHCAVCVTTVEFSAPSIQGDDEQSRPGDAAQDILAARAGARPIQRDRQRSGQNLLNCAALGAPPRPQGASQPRQ